MPNICNLIAENKMSREKAKEIQLKEYNRLEQILSRPELLTRPPKTVQLCSQAEFENASFEMREEYLNTWNRQLIKEAFSDDIFVNIYYITRFPSGSIPENEAPHYYSTKFLNLAGLGLFPEELKISLPEDIGKFQFNRIYLSSDVIDSVPNSIIRAVKDRIIFNHSEIFIEYLSNYLLHSTGPLDQHGSPTTEFLKLCSLDKMAAEAKRFEDEKNTHWEKEQQIKLAERKKEAEIIATARKKQLEVREEALRHRIEDEQQRQMQLFNSYAKANVNRILDRKIQLEKRAVAQIISRVDSVLLDFEHHINPKDPHAHALLNKLKQARNNYEWELELKSPMAKDTFLKSCEQEINKAKPELEKLYGWDYFKNLLIKLINAVTKLFTNNPQAFYSPIKSANSTAAEKLISELAAEEVLLDIPLHGC